ncbi:hypothetical protein IL306_005326 [Fusarium sp. DS 682]|nr:hypothetical protein IL306_005326 [Fusarium sp. DS 682]
MPLPKTDEDIKAGWGPKQWTFHKWALENSQAIQDTLKLDAEWDALDKLIARRWPNQKDQDEYYAWSRQWNGRFMLRLCYKWTTQDFINQVLSTNFLNAKESIDLWWAMDMYNLPFIPLGHAKFADVESFYAFEPSARCITPHRNESAPSVMGKQILAMDVRFQEASTESIASGSSGTDDSSSNCSNASSTFSKPEKPGHRFCASTDSLHQPHDPVELARNEIDPDHFVFAQLGMLYVFGGDYNSARIRDSDVFNEGTWWRNGLVVVVRLDHKGRCGAVYVLYDPKSDIKADNDSDDDSCEDSDDDYYEDSDEEELAPEAERHTPGRLNPDCKEGFLLAKVANNLNELGQMNKEFQFLPITSVESLIHRAQLLEHGEGGRIISPAFTMDHEKDESHKPLRPSIHRQHIL